MPTLLSYTVTAWRKEGSFGGSLSWALTQQPLDAFPSPDQPRRAPPKMQYLKAVLPASFPSKLTSVELGSWSVVKSIYCSCRGPGLDSQYPHGRS